MYGWIYHPQTICGRLTWVLKPINRTPVDNMHANIQCELKQFKKSLSDMKNKIPVWGFLMDIVPIVLTRFAHRYLQTR